MTTEEMQRRVTEVFSEYYGDNGDMAICWCATVEVIKTDSRRYLSHLAGGGHEGTDAPTTWAVVGMLQAAQMNAASMMGRGGGGLIS